MKCLEQSEEFLSKRSRIDAIVELLESIQIFLLNEKNSFCAFIDLSKAFDAVNNEIALRRCSRYGLRGKPFSFLKSYQEIRYQFVQKNRLKITQHKIKCGVPISSGSTSISTLHQGSLQNFKKNNVFFCR